MFMRMPSNHSQCMDVCYLLYLEKFKTFCETIGHKGVEIMRCRPLTVGLSTDVGASVAFGCIPGGCFIPLRACCVSESRRASCVLLNFQAHGFRGFAWRSSYSPFPLFINAKSIHSLQMVMTRYFCQWSFLASRCLQALLVYPSCTYLSALLFYTLHGVVPGWSMRRCPTELLVYVGIRMWRTCIPPLLQRNHGRLLYSPRGSFFNFQGSLDPAFGLRWWEWTAQGWKRRSL